MSSYKSIAKTNIPGPPLREQEMRGEGKAVRSDTIMNSDRLSPSHHLNSNKWLAVSLIESFFPTLAKAKQISNSNVC